MKLLLVQPLNYLVACGGAHKGNRAMMEQLAARGHDCRVVAPARADNPAMGNWTASEFCTELHTRGIPVRAVSDEAIVFVHHGVEVHAVMHGHQLFAQTVQQIRAFDPDWVLVSEDRSFIFLQAALEVCAERVVYISQSPATLPFGPAAFVPNAAQTELLRQSAGIITLSNYMQDYIRQWGGMESFVFRFPAYGPEPFPRFTNFDCGFVTMINPSAIKGISIFADLATRMPEVPFAAVPTWSTTDEDRARLAALPNVQLLPASDNIDDIFAQTRVLLVPSLWGESFGLVVVEAMLRGIPVIASNVGGLPEARLGVDYLLPVRPIEQYEQHAADAWVPVPIIPPQDLAPWQAALERLLTNRDHYSSLAEASRAAAQAYVNSLSVAPVEDFLAQLGARAAAAARTRSAASEAAATLQSADRRTLLALRLRQQRTDSSNHQPIPQRSPGDDLPLSFAQQRLWFLDQLAPGNPAYNNLTAVRMQGKLDIAALHASLIEIARRHEALRTIFPAVNGAPTQVILPQIDLPFPVIDLRSIPADQREAHAKEQAVRENGRPFDLERGPLFRAALLQMEDDSYVLLVGIHHIVSDGWSVGVLVRELLALYEAQIKRQPKLLPDLPIQYADFARWQRERLQGSSYAELLDYWKKQLSGAATVLELPTDRPRPPMQTFKGGMEVHTLDRSLSDTIKLLGQQEGSTLFMTLLAAFKTLLYRYTGQGDISIGAPIANRNRVELEGLIGFFVNMLVLRTELTGDLPFRTLLQRVRQTALDAYAHQDVPFEKLVEELRPERDLSRNPLFQVTFVLQNAHIPEQELPGLTFTPFELDRETVNFDLAMVVWEHPDGLRIFIEYNYALFDASTIQRMLSHFETLLGSIVANPDQAIGQLALLPAAERRQLVEEWNATAVAYPQVHCLHQLIEEQVERSPEAIAVSYASQRLSYRDLNARANQLAHSLHAQGVGPGTLVGIAAERSLELVVGLLGILKAGAAYVPLDPSYPRERLAMMLEDVQVPVLLTQEHLLATLPPTSARLLCLDRDWPQIAAFSSSNPLGGRDPDQLAYMIYTSGSTGRPKGALNTHRGICNRLLWMQQHYQLTPSDRVLQKTPFSFDVSVWEFFWPLLVGARLVMARPEGHKDPTYLVATIISEQISTIHFVPSMLQLFLEEPDVPRCTSLQRVICSGEALSYDLQSRFFARSQAALFNLYGPTEAAVDVTWWDCTRGSTERLVPIGRPVANTQIYILDPQGQPVPIGVAGELHIGGVQVGRGYYQRPDITAARFIPDPFARTLGPDGAPMRLYKTGDLARYRPDGSIEYLGRLDFQVKLRGLRIELGEIEAVLGQHPALREVVVQAHTVTAGDTRLVAYVVPHADAEHNGLIRELRAFLSTRLPDYMVPGHMMLLEALPLNPSGKVDRKALPAPEQTRLALAEGFVAPRDTIELQLAQIWEDVLQIRPVGVNDNFFDLGGHSLLAVQLMAAIQRQFGRDLPLATLFQGPTIERLAQILREQPTAQAWSPLVPMQPRGERPPFFCVHPVGGNVLCYVDLAQQIGLDQPFYALQSPGLDGVGEPFNDIRTMASSYIAALRSVQAHGPYRLGGWCFGGAVAFEMARQLQDQGEEVVLLAMFDTYAPIVSDQLPDIDYAILVSWFVRDMAVHYGKELQVDPAELRGLSPDEQLHAVLERLQAAQLMPADSSPEQLRRYLHVYTTNAQAMQHYAPQRYHGPVTIFRASEFYHDREPTLGWQYHLAFAPRLIDTPGTHNSMIFGSNATVLAEQLRACLDETVAPLTQAVGAA